MKIAIFASGSGTNAEAIINYFNKTKTAQVSLILSNVPNAFVLERAKKFGIKSVVFSRNELNSNAIVALLRENNIDFIVLAGFLWLVPTNLVAAFTNRIINIHPALLPKFGGKGMYGMNVHKAVIEAGEKQSGITVHFVNTNYDEGNIIFQAACNISANETPESLAEKIHALEHKHFAKVIETILLAK